MTKRNMALLWASAFLLWIILNLTACTKEQSNETKCGIVLSTTPDGMTVQYQNGQIEFFADITHKAGDRYCR